METTLYAELVKQGITVHSHYSDLYFPVTEQTREVLARFPDQKGITTTFINQVEGGLWYDTPFAYIPYWEQKQAEGKKLAEAKKSRLTA
jgi:hypothetical protein